MNEIINTCSFVGVFFFRNIDITDKWFLILSIENLIEFIRKQSYT